MKLYEGGRAPNPRRVRIFLAEKGINIPIEQVDIATHQHRADAYTAINPMQRLPALLLDDGTAIAESIAICRYFEGLDPDPPLFGRGSLECALVELWNRRVEFHLFLPVTAVFSASASLHEGAGRSAGAGVGRGQQTAHRRVPHVPRRRTQEADLRRGRELQRCRHHRAGRRRFHEGLEVVRA
jgi:glutathione S-transferase